MHEWTAFAGFGLALTSAICVIGKVLDGAQEMSGKHYQLIWATKTQERIYRGRPEDIDALFMALLQLKNFTELKRFGADGRLLESVLAPEPPRGRAEICSQPHNWHL